MKIWTDRNGKVHSKGSGDVRKQMSEVDAIINYLQNYAQNCRNVSNKVMCFDTTLCNENEELRRQLKVACNTIDAADKAMREKRSANKN